MIDKSLGQYQQLVKKGKGNRRPGYRGDDWGGPSYGGSSSRSSGGDRSHDRGGAQHRAAAQRAAPAPSPHRDDSAERAAQAAADALNAAREAEARESAREKAIQVAALTPKTIEPIRSAHVDTPTQIAEQKEIDLYGYQDAKAKAPTTLIPKTVTYDRGVPFTDTPIKTTVGQTLFDPRTSQNALLKRGSGLGTLGKILLTGATAGAGAGLFGKDIANIANVAKWVGRGKNIKTALDTGKLNVLGKEFNLPSNLTSNIDKARGRRFDPKDPIGWTGEQKRTFHEGKGDGERVAEKATVEEAISGKEALGIDFDELRKKQFIMKNALDEGYYTDNEGRTIQLTDEQKLMLKNYITRIDDVMKEYLVDPRAMSAYGGRIDKPLTGRSRDI